MTQKQRNGRMNRFLFAVRNRRKSFWLFSVSLILLLIDGLLYTQNILNYKLSLYLMLVFGSLAFLSGIFFAFLALLSCQCPLCGTMTGGFITWMCPICHKEVIKYGDAGTGHPG